MKFRKFGKTNWQVSEIGLGTWQVGGRWGSAFDATNADKTIRAAIDQGINFIDTADVYSDGLSEEAVGKAVRASKEKVYVATKCGRGFNPHTDASYNTSDLRKFVEASLTNTGLDCIDLIQLHCPPNDTYYRPEIFGLFEDLKKEGKIQAMGVSVEKVEQGIKALQYDSVCSIQIIYNIFRQRPHDLFFDLASKKDVAILARVPLASGLLSGQYTSETAFADGDHRTFNREGAAFDKGETFSGIPYALGLEAVQKLKHHFGNQPMHHVAIKWILMQASVSCVIPGASNPSQAIANCTPSASDDLTAADLDYINQIYNTYIKDSVHQIW